MLNHVLSEVLGPKKNMYWSWAGYPSTHKTKNSYTYVRIRQKSAHAKKNVDPNITLHACSRLLMVFQPWLCSFWAFTYLLGPFHVPFTALLTIAHDCSLLLTLAHGNFVFQHSGSQFLRVSRCEMEKKSEMGQGYGITNPSAIDSSAFSETLGRGMLGAE